MKKIIFLIVFLFLGIINYSQFLFAQIIISTTQTPLQMATSLAGNGVVVSNANYYGVLMPSKGYQIGTFTASGNTITQLGFNNGIALSTGDVKALPLSPGTDPRTVATLTGAYQSSHAGEVRKSSATGNNLSDGNFLSNNSSWFNASILEFDFVPICDNFSFRYVFGSEEYDENNTTVNYQCSDYNDKFAFLISGPGINGTGYSNSAVNLAKLSNGSDVGINSVNNGKVGFGMGSPAASKCTSANPNWTQNSAVTEFKGQIDGIQFNGNTKVLTASKSGLTPGATYHIKFMVVDLMDGGYDSGVFLESGSFSSPALTSTQKINTNGTKTNSTIITEGCSSGEIEFTLAPVTTSNYPLNYTVTGSAINGTDYPNLNGSTSILANQSTTILSINPTDDAITETTPETVVISGSTCSGSTSKTFSIVDPLKVTCSATSNSIIFNWNINGATQYNYSYSISGGPAVTGNTASDVTTFTVPSLTSGKSVTITITPSFGVLGDGCPGTSTCSITGCTSPAAPVVTSPVSYCQNDIASALSATALSGNTLKWYGTAQTGGTSSPSATLPLTTTVGQTTYYVSQTTSDGCESTRSPIIVDIKAKPSITVNSPTICTNQTATLNAIGATSYSWDVVGGATGVSTSANFTTPQLTSNTSYSVTGTTLGCTGTATAVVTVAANLSITVNSPTICTNQTAILTANGGTTYSWDEVGGATGISTSNPFTTPTLTANKSYKVTGSTGTCTGHATATITVLPNLTIVVNSPTICSGQTATLTAIGGTTYSWDIVGGATGISTSNPFTTPILNSNTSYKVTGTTGSCTGDATATVTVNPTPTVSVNSLTICNNQTATLISSGATSYSWDKVGGATGISANASFTTPNLTANTSYVVTGTTGSCSNSATSIVTVTPLINIVVNSPSICTGNNATISVSGANSYLWSDGSTQNSLIVSPTSTTTYTVTGSIGTCTGTGSSTVTVNETPLLVIGTTPSGCAPKKVNLTDPSLTNGSTIGSTFQYWVNASGTLPLTSPSSVGDGTYYISSTKNGCSSTPIAVPVVINPIPIADFTPSPYLVSTISPVSKMINQSIDAVKFFWDFGDGGVSEEISPTHTFSDSDTASYIIRLIANSTLGCSDTTYKKLKVYEELVYFVPNTFTPDQDDFNNTFQPVFVSGFDPYTFTMTIFNRWGEMVFETHDSKIGWKGTYGKDNTEIAKEGVYTWKIEFSLKSDDRRKQITGVVNLIK